MSDLIRREDVIKLVNQFVFNAYNNGYNKAIDDFSSEIDKYIERYDGTIYDEAYYTNVKSDFEDLKKICNQLKAGV